MTSYILSAFKIYLTSYTGLSRSCWQGIFLGFVNSTLGGMLYFLSIYFVNILHTSVSQSGTIIACYGIGAILGGFIGGKLSDRFSPKSIQTLGLVMQAIGYFAFIKLRAPSFLMANTFLLGIANYAFITANYLFVLERINIHENLRLRAINLLSMSANLGLALSAIVIGAFVKFGFENIFYVTGSLFFLAACFLQFQKREIISSIHSGQTNNSDSSNIFNKNSLIIWTVLFCVFLTGIIITQLCTTYAIYLQTLFPTMGLKAASILFALNSLLIVLFEAPLVGLFDKQNKLLMVGIGSLLIGLGFYILDYAPLFLIAIISCIVYTIGEMIFFSMAQLICYQKSNRKKGQSMGLYRMIYASSRVIGPIIGVTVYSQLGGNSVWFLCGMIGIVCMCVCAANKKYYYEQ